MSISGVTIEGDDCIYRYTIYKISWTYLGHYKVHVHGQDSPGCPIHGHYPISLPALAICSVVTGRDMGHGMGRDGTVQDMFPIFYVRDIFGTFFI